MILHVRRLIGLWVGWLVGYSVGLSIITSYAILSNQASEKATNNEIKKSSASIITYYIHTYMFLFIHKIS